MACSSCPYRNSTTRTMCSSLRSTPPLSFFRKLVYFLPLFLLPRFFGARATFYAEPISDIIAPVVSIFIYAVAMKRILKKPVIPNF